MDLHLNVFYLNGLPIPPLNFSDLWLFSSKVFDLVNTGKFDFHHLLLIMNQVCVRHVKIVCYVRVNLMMIVADKLTYREIVCAFSFFLVFLCVMKETTRRKLPSNKHVCSVYEKHYLMEKQFH